MAAVLDGTDTPDSPYDPAALDAVSSYEEELRVSREDLLRKIEASSRDIAGRCRTAVEQSNEQEHAALFDDEERERVVEACAAKLKAPPTGDHSSVTRSALMVHAKTEAFVRRL